MGRRRRAHNHKILTRRAINERSSASSRRTSTTMKLSRHLVMAVLVTAATTITYAYGKEKKNGSSRHHPQKTSNTGQRHLNLFDGSTTKTGKTPKAFQQCSFANPTLLQAALWKVSHDEWEEKGLIKRKTDAIHPAPEVVQDIPLLDAVLHAQRVTEYFMKAVEAFVESGGYPKAAYNVGKQTREDYASHPNVDFTQAVLVTVALLVQMTITCDYEEMALTYAVAAPAFIAGFLGVVMEKLVSLVRAFIAEWIGDGPLTTSFGRAWKEVDHNCDEGCDLAKGSPVCGEDGITYFNQCLAVCQDVTIERNGACPGEPPMNMKSYRSEGFVPIAQMNAQKQKDGVFHFKFVARRRAIGQVVLPSPRKPEGQKPGGPGPSNGNGVRRATRIVPAGTEGHGGDVLEYRATYDLEELPSDEPTLPVDGDEDEELPESEPESTVPQSRRHLFCCHQDTRIQITATNVQNYNRYQRVVRLDYPYPEPYNFNPDSLWGRCSGAIIADSKILTAAHCIWDRLTNAPILPSHVAPGRTGGLSTQDGYYYYITDYSLYWPYGRWEVIKCDIINDTYKTGDDNYWIDFYGYDIAVCTTANIGNQSFKQIGKKLGRFGLAKQPCMPFQEQNQRSAGYPGDKNGGTLWDTGVCDDWYYECGSELISHLCDGSGGQSGSAFWNENEQINAVFIAEAAEPDNAPTEFNFVNQLLGNFGAALNEENLRVVKGLAELI